jgi:hypothetical protein
LQELLAIAFAQRFKRRRILATRGHPVALVEQPLQQRQAKSIACACNPKTA